MPSKELENHYRDSFHSSAKGPAGSPTGKKKNPLTIGHMRNESGGSNHMGLVAQKVEFVQGNPV